LDEKVLSVTLRRLYELSEHKMMTVREMKTVNGGEVGEAWTWRRRLLVWYEDQVREYCELLNYIVLQDSLADKW